MTQLTPRHFMSAEVLRNQWVVVPEFGTPPEALLSPAYWAHVSSQLTRGDIITALPEDNSYYSEMLVMDAGKLYARVTQLRCIQLDSTKAFDVTIPEGYEVKFRGPRKWSVLRGKDVLVQDKDKPGVEQWIREHLAVA